MGENTYGYAYDPLGNRTVTTENLETTEYAANNLNQYSQISVPSVPSVVNPSYDLDGNMLTNGVWSFTWDAENRLASAMSNGVCLVTNIYDHRSRRIAAITADETRSFLWDGWNIFREVRDQGSEVSTNYYTWGLDLSCSLQGAGGVGGLLAVSTVSPADPQPVIHFPMFDANGNVTEYISTNGTVAARYAYDAFGATTAQSGDMADAFTHRFSTKPFDAEIGSYYYGYRHYGPEWGCWFNRDPIEEQGGLNLYGFVGNDPVNRWDGIGLKAASPFEFVGANPIIQDGGIYLGLWFGANDYLDRYPVYALFTVSLNVNVSECKRNGKNQTFNDSNNFFASRADGDVMISSKEIYLNPLNSRGVGKNKNGTTGGWRDFIPNKKNGQLMFTICNIYSFLFQRRNSTGK